MHRNSCCCAYLLLHFLLFLASSIKRFHGLELLHNKVT
jgi:hypothetical protein